MGARFKSFKVENWFDCGKKETLLQSNATLLKKFGGNIAEKHFFEIVRTGFAHKRKFLSGNLREIFGEAAPEILSRASIPEKSRAENLTLVQWLSFARLKSNSILKQ